MNYDTTKSFTWFLTSFMGVFWLNNNVKIFPKIFSNKKKLKFKILSLIPLKPEIFRHFELNLHKTNKKNLLMS